MRLKIGILCVVIALACIGSSCGKKGEESPSHTGPSVDDNELPIITDPDLD